MSEAVSESPASYSTSPRKLDVVYETILSTTDDFAYIFDPQGRFIYANARLLKVWAKTLDQVIGKTCHELGYPTWHADLHMREIQQIVRTKAPLRGEVPFTGDSGISGIYDYIFQPVLNAAGEVEVVVGTTRDVTDRKKGEEQLKAAQIELQQKAKDLEAALKAQSEAAAKFEALFDQSVALAGIIALDGTLIEANKVALEGCGYREEDVVGRPFWTCGWWRSSDKVQQHVREGIALAASGKTFHRTIPSMLANGTVRMVDFTIYPIRDDAGTIIFLHPVGLDVTDRLQAEARADFLSGLTQKLSILSDEDEINSVATREIGHFLNTDRCFFIHALPDKEKVRALSDWRREGLVTIAGDHALKQFGSSEWAEAYKRDSFRVNDVRRHPWTQEFAESYDVVKLAAYAIAPCTLEGHWVACVVVGSSEPRRWTDDEMSLLENVVARVWPLIERGRTESALRGTQAALRKANDLLSDKASHLESVVQERTAKLRESIEELEAFSYSISHDMRAPLRAMRAFSSILSEEHSAQLDDAGKELLDRINAASRRMDQLIQDVLNFSRISRQEVTLGPIDPNKLIEELIRSYPNLDPKVIDVEIPQPLPLVMANDALLTQCVSNILDNAVKFTVPDRKPRVIITSELIGDRVKIHFKDNGIGISPENIERIFEIFQRVGRDTPGTGIGLAIVRKAAEKMNGKAGVNSELGHGSDFWLDLKSI